MATKNGWDAAMVGRIALQLRACPAELRYFLAKIESDDDDDADSEEAVSYTHLRAHETL